MLNKLIKNKRGDAFSLIIGLVIMIFVIAVISLCAGKFITELMDVMKNDSAISANNGTMKTLNLISTHSIPWLDYFYLFVFISTIIGIIISSMYIDTHPAMLMVFVIVLVFAIILAGILANAYVTIGETDAVSSIYGQFKSTNAIFNNLPLILFVTGILVIIVLYGKSRSSGGSPI